MNRQDRTLSVGHRADGTSWQIPVVQLTGAKPGPTTAFVGGTLGDKPLGIMAMHRLIADLDSRLGELAGTVVVIPAANPAAIETNTRFNPDHLQLTRQFPGRPTGLLTDQIAHALYTELIDIADCIVDVHSGTVTASLGYIYDYGDLALSSSFGYLPVVVDHAIPGQLTAEASRAGKSALLPEFGGGLLDDPALGVHGCLNVLRHRGQLTGEITGPRTVPVVRNLTFHLASKAGILCSHLDSRHIGDHVPRGVVAWIVDPGTGERVEEFTCEMDDCILLGARVKPSHISPGDFAFTYGQVERHADVGTG